MKNIIFASKSYDSPQGKFTSQLSITIAMSQTIFVAKSSIR